jgi:hypothetical protein
MDATPLGETTAVLMDRLSDQFEEFEDAEIGSVLVIAEVILPTDGPEGSTGIHFRCSDPRQWVQQGLLHYALNAAVHPDHGEDDGD